MCCKVLSVLTSGVLHVLVLVDCVSRAVGVLG